MKEPTVEVALTALLQLGALSFEMSRSTRDVTGWAVQHGKLKHAKAPYAICYDALNRGVYYGAFAVSDGRFDSPEVKPFRFWVVSPAALARSRQPVLSVMCDLTNPGRTRVPACSTTPRRRSTAPSLEPSSAPVLAP